MRYEAINGCYRAMILRAATLADARVLYEWRNDPSTRLGMHTTARFDYPSHCEWLTRSLETGTRKIYIAEVDGTPVGTVRTDLVEGMTEFSWTISPEHRGRGFGKQMVTMAVALVAGPIHVEVKSGNVASARIAEEVGLRREREENGVVHYFR